MEFDGFVGLLLLAGVYKSKNESLIELWSERDGRSTMTLNRFKSILKYCRFDDKNTRRARAEVDKLAPIRDIWDMFIAQLPKFYKPGADLTVDEQLVAFKGKCGLRQYMPSKPAKYGINVWWNCGKAATSYPLKGQVYLGRQPDQPRETNLGSRIVEDLVRPWFNRGRNVVMDNFFTSAALAEYLLNQDMTLVGTLRKNRREIPPEMTTKASIAARDE